MLTKDDRYPVAPAAPDPPPSAAFFHASTTAGVDAWLSTLETPFELKASSPGPIELKLSVALLDDMCFATGSSRSGFELVAADPFDGYGMTLPVAGSMFLNTVDHKMMAPEFGNGVITDLASTRKICYSPQSEFKAFVVGGEELHRHIALITEQPVRQRVVFLPYFQRNLGASRFIFAVSQALLTGLQGDAPLKTAPAALASLRDAVLSMLVEGIPHNYSDLFGKRIASPAPRNVKRAIEFMHAHVTDPMLLQEIALAAQTSPRSLQMAFRQFRGVTPMEYLRRLRLDGARNEMLNGPGRASVSDVAYRWGFAHHGIFSTRYKLAFGELPSTTLKRNRSV
ncbi:MAG: AraC family transcriptional regulator [Variovorax sp.]|nr:MAG: AraC family transcriptional regulator [Variovorax sp.]